MDRYPRFLVVSGVALAFIALAWLSVFVRGVERYQRPNALHHATSPYLRACRYQPVQWQEWNSVTFLQAERTKKPILVELGAFWSARCLQADKELYQDPYIAALINQNAIPVKVDADAQPEVKRFLQLQARFYQVPDEYPMVLLLNSQGYAFLATALLPRPVFIRWLEDAFRFYREESQQMAQRVQAVQRFLVRFVMEAARSDELTPALYQNLASNLQARLAVPPETLLTTERSLLPLLHFLLWQAEEGSFQVREQLVSLLVAARKSPLYASSTGGFYAFTAGLQDRKPLGGQRLEENAALLEIYARAYRLTHHPLLEQTAHGLLDFLRHHLWSERPPGFYAALRPFYSPPDLKAELQLLPPMDNSLYAMGNARAVFALLTYVQTFDPQSERVQWAREAARRTFETLRSLRTVRGELYHSTHRQVRDYLLDEIWTVRAALAVYRLFNDPRALEFAQSLLNHVLADHRDPLGGFYDLGHAHLWGKVRIEPIRVGWDGESSADNGVVVLALLEMAQITDDNPYRPLAGRTLQAFAGSVPEYGVFAASYTEALGRYLQR